MGKILIVDDGTESSMVLLNALQLAYKGGVVVIDSLSTFKENKTMNLWPIASRIELIRDLGECYSDPWGLRKDFSRSMFLTDARSKRPSHKGRKKKVNRLRVRKRVQNRHRRNK